MDQWSMTCVVALITRQRHHGYISQNLHCHGAGPCRHRLARRPTRGCKQVRRHPRTSLSARRYQVRKSEWKCPRLFPYRDVDRSLGLAHPDPSLIQLSHPILLTTAIRGRAVSVITTHRDAIAAVSGIVLSASDSCGFNGTRLCQGAIVGGFAAPGTLHCHGRSWRVCDTLSKKRRILS
jgi:hypothetical protein